MEIPYIPYTTAEQDEAIREIVAELGEDSRLATMFLGLVSHMFDYCEKETESLNSTIDELEEVKRDLQERIDQLEGENEELQDELDKRERE